MKLWQPGPWFLQPTTVFNVRHYGNVMASTNDVNDKLHAWICEHSSVLSLGNPLRLGSGQVQYNIYCWCRVCTYICEWKVFNEARCNRATEWAKGIITSFLRTYSPISILICWALAHHMIAVSGNGRQLTGYMLCNAFPVDEVCICCVCVWYLTRSHHTSIIPMTLAARWPVDGVRFSSSRFVRPECCCHVAFGKWGVDSVARITRSASSPPYRSHCLFDLGVGGGCGFHAVGWVEMARLGEGRVVIGGWIMMGKNDTGFGTKRTEHGPVFACNLQELSIAGHGHGGRREPSPYVNNVYLNDYSS